jgi:hypothetical protein
MSDGDPDAEAGPEQHVSAPGVSRTAGEEPPEPSDTPTDGSASDDAGPVDTELPDTEDLTGPVQRLEPQIRLVWVLQSAISALVVGAVVGAPALLVFGEPLLGPSVFTLLFVIGTSLALFRYRSWRYEVRQDSLFLERGVLTHTKTVVPYVRIQHVDASRGPLERAFGLATAVVYTAGSRGADVSIPGLTPARADDLQDRLKRLAIAAEGEDAV